MNGNSFKDREWVIWELVIELSKSKQFQSAKLPREFGILWFNQKIKIGGKIAQIVDFEKVFPPFLHFSTKIGLAFRDFA